MAVTDSTALFEYNLALRQAHDAVVYAHDVLLGRANYEMTLHLKPVHTPAPSPAE